MQTPIEGVLLEPLTIVPVEGGPVLKALRVDSPFYAGFGELYFSEVEPGYVKAWKSHARQTQQFIVPVGQLKIVLYDDREDSSTRYTLFEVLLGRPDHYNLLRIPPHIWYGFTAAGEGTALICNCADIPHDPAEGLRKSSNSLDIPYHW